MRNIKTKTEFIDGQDYIEWFIDINADLFTKKYRLDKGGRDNLLTNLKVFLERYLVRCRLNNIATKYIYNATLLFSRLSQLYWNDSQFLDTFNCLCSNLKHIQKLIIFRFDLNAFIRQIQLNLCMTYMRVISSGVETRNEKNEKNENDRFPYKMDMMIDDLIIIDQLKYGLSQQWDIAIIKRSLAKKYHGLDIHVIRIINQSIRIINSSENYLSISYFCRIHHWLYTKELKISINGINETDCTLYITVNLDSNEYPLYELEIKTKAIDLFKTSNPNIDYIPILVMTYIENQIVGNPYTSECRITYKYSKKPLPNEMVDKPEVLVDLGEYKLLL